MAAEPISGRLVPKSRYPNVGALMLGIGERIADTKARTAIPLSAANSSPFEPYGREIHLGKLPARMHGIYSSLGIYISVIVYFRFESCKLKFRGGKRFDHPKVSTGDVLFHAFLYRDGSGVL